MKKKNLKKLLLTVCCAALLVCVSIGATVAYLTSQDTVENTFTVGKVAITLDEAKVDANGTPQKENEDKTFSSVEDVKDATRVKANSYKLMPGHVYTKDPTVHVAADSEDSWIFVKVENGIATYEADGNTKIEAQIAANEWTKLDGVDGVYYKSYTSSQTATNLIVFSQFKIADNAQSLSDWNEISADTTKVTVNAYAIQKDGFETVNKAWEALSNQIKGN